MPGPPQPPAPRSRTGILTGGPHGPLEALREGQPLTKDRATGRDIVLAIGENMRQSLEPLVTKTIAPSLYQVYLHADDYDRLRTLFGELEGEAKRCSTPSSRGSTAARPRRSPAPAQEEGRAAGRAAVRQRRGAVDGPLPGGPERHAEPRRRRGGLRVRPAAGGGLSAPATRPTGSPPPGGSAR